MNLEKNYELLDIVSDDGIRTHKAREIASGRAFDVHLFVKKEDQAIFERLRELPLSARRPLLEFGRQLQIPYIITDPIPGETNARSWFTTLLMPPQNAPEPRSQPIKAAVWKTGTPLPDPLFPDDAQDASPANGEPGEFTRMFQIPARQQEKPKAQSPEPEASPSVPPKPRIPDAPGEFTRMFESPGRSAPTPAPEPPPAEAPVAASVNETGEFTRMFKAAAAPPPPKPPEAPSPVPPSAPTPPDEAATKLFQVPPAPHQPIAQGPEARAEARPEAPAASAPVSKPAPPPPVPPQDPGEFTQMFESVKLKPAGSAEPDKPAGPGEFTKMFQSPLSPRDLPKSSTADPFPVPPAQRPEASGQTEFTRMFGNGSAGPVAPPFRTGDSPGAGSFSGSATGAFATPLPSTPRVQEQKSEGPSEFTRMMSRPSAPTLGQQSAEPQAPARAAKSNMVLWIILGSLALFAILIILFFALRR